MNNIDFDIDRVETIVYEPWDIPDPEDYDVNDYDSEEEMRQDMLQWYTFLVDFYDSFGEKLNWRNVELSYSDVVDEFGEEIANDMVNSMGISRGGKSFELTIGADTTPKSMSLKDVDDVAKRVIPTTEYYKGCRGYILYDGTIIETQAEHNMVSIIDGIDGTFQFIALGNIRILDKSVDLAKEPTPQQRRVLAQVINSYSDGEFYLDIMTGDNIGVKYYQVDHRKVLADIDRYFNEGIKPTGNEMYEEKILTEKRNEETTFYRFYSEVRHFLSKLLKTPIKAEPTKYLTDRGFKKQRLIKLLMDNNILRRDEKILVPGKDAVEHVKYSVKYTLSSDKFEDKIEKIFGKYFGRLNEEMDMYSCPNIIGVVSGRGKGVGSEMCERWANYVNDNKNKPRKMFKSIEEEPNKETSKSLWNEFSKYLDIVSEVVTFRYSVRLLNEEEHIPSFSSIPNGLKMWGDVSNYCREYIKTHDMTDYGTYGMGYIIEVPTDSINSSIWDTLECKIVLTDINSVTPQVKTRLERENKYYYLTDESDIDYVKKHGKIKTVRLRLTQVDEPKNFLGDELCVKFFHEMLHVYEDYSRVMSKADTLFRYQNSANYNDYQSTKRDVTQGGWREVNLFTNLFHFFNKSELRAMVSEFSGEVQNHSRSRALDNGALDGTYDIVTSTKAWKKICDAEDIISTINSIQSDDLKNELLNIYNKHVVRGKVNSYEAMLKHINRYFWNIKQTMFKKFSKILFDIYNYNNKHSIR